MIYWKYHAFDLDSCVVKDLLHFFKKLQLDSKKTEFFLKLPDYILDLRKNGFSLWIPVKILIILFMITVIDLWAGNLNLLQTLWFFFFHVLHHGPLCWINTFVHFFQMWLKDLNFLGCKISPLRKQSCGIDNNCR